MNKLSVLSSFCLLIFVACQGRSQGEKQVVSDEIKPVVINVNNSSRDSLFFKNIVEAIEVKELTQNDCIIEVAKLFLETPYVASTLEKEGEEQLVINLREIDCTTFVEYVLAASLCINNEKTAFGDFVQQLAILRYRNGIINGYPSRLHYFSDWLHDNKNKGLIEIISDQIGDSTLDVAVDFMSTHPKSYKQLANELYLEEIRVAEAQIATYNMKYISKNNIESVTSLIKNGDVIGLVTTIDGLDISHVGFAIHYNGRLHFIHASSSESKVVITDIPLSEYLSESKRIEGIVVARVKMKM